MKKLHVRSHDLQKVREHIRSGHKIRAVKALRDATHCGLREAKMAVENLGNEMSHVTPNSGSYPANAEVRAVALCSIQKVEIELGRGVIMVDLDEAQFHVMRELGNVPLEESRRLLKLIEILDDFSKGRDIG
jgi:hydrogenase maturation factor